MTRTPSANVIAIDGPAASGKSTAAKLLAQRMNIRYVNSGIMYRALTYHCLNKNISPDDIPAVAELANSIVFSFNDRGLLVNQKDLSREVKQPSVENNVSAFAKIPEVREIMTQKQRDLSHQGALIMDGRDIGSFVFPDARYKFYIDASIETRARRRYQELSEQFPLHRHSFTAIISDITQRDEMDKNRAVSPLIRAADAYYIDTSDLTVEETVSALYNIISEEDPS